MRDLPALLNSISGLARTANPIFDDFIRDIDRTFSGDPAFFRGSANDSWMRIDVQEEDDHYLVQVDVPGAEKGNVDIDWHEKVLTIAVKAESEKEQKSEENGYLYRERSARTGRRQIRLEKADATSEPTASLDNGVLEVRVNKASEARPKKVTVK